jgi:hypothetical protein
MADLDSYADELQRATGVTALPQDEHEQAKTFSLTGLFNARW